MMEKKNLKEWSCLKKRLFRQCCFVGPREWSPIDFPLLPRELPKQLLLCLEVQDRQHVWQNHGGDCRFWCKEWQFWMLIRSTCIRQYEYLSKWSSSYMSTIFLNRTLNDLSIFFLSEILVVIFAAGAKFWFRLLLCWLDRLRWWQHFQSHRIHRFSRERGHIWGGQCAEHEIHLWWICNEKRIWHQGDGRGWGWVL